MPLEPQNLAIASAVWTAATQTAVYTLSAAGMSAVAIPPLRRIMAPEPPVNRRSKRLPFRNVSLDGTITHTKGQLSRVYILRGLDPTVMTTIEREAEAKAKLNWLVSLNTGNVIARLVLRNVRDQIPPGPTHPVPLIAMLADRQHKSLDPYYKVQTHIVLTTKNKGADAVAALADAEIKLMGRLSRYLPNRLTQEKGDALGFFAEFTSPIQRPRPAGAGSDMSVLFPDHIQINFPKSYIRFKNGTQTRYMGVWTLSVLGSDATPSLTRDLMAVDANLVLFQGAEVDTKADSTKKLKRKEKFGKSLDSSKVNELLTEAVNEIQGETEPECTLKFAWTLFGYANHPDELEALQTKIITAMGGSGFTPAREGAFLQRGYDALFPPNKTTSTPRLFFGTQAANGLALIQSAPGNTKSQWFPKPWVWFKTSTGELYPFTWHVTAEDNDPLAHGACFGRPGTGKTTRMLYLAQLTLQNPQSQVFWWDKYQGAYTATKALGPLGRYIRISADEAYAQLNPCQLPDGPENRQHLRQLLSIIVAGTVAKIENISARLSRQIDTAVEINFHPATPMRHRNFKYLVQTAFPPPRDGTDEELGLAYMAMRRWIDTNAGYFCATEDQLALTGARWFTFDIEEVQRDPQAAALVTTDLMHRVFQSLRRQRRPTLAVIDEPVEALQIPMMLSMFDTFHTQIRRMDGAIWSLWQNPGQMRELKADSIVKQNALSRMVIPDDRASREEYKEILGFADTHLDIITKDHPITHTLQHPTLLDRPDHSVLLSMDLEGMKRGTRIYRGLKGAQRLQDLEQQFGPEEGFRRYLSA